MSAWVSAGERRSGSALPWKTPPCPRDSMPVRNPGSFGVHSPELRGGLCVAFFAWGPGSPGAPAHPSVRGALLFRSVVASGPGGGLSRREDLVFGQRCVKSWDSLGKSAAVSGCPHGDYRQLSVPRRTPENQFPRDVSQHARAGIAELVKAALGRACHKLLCFPWVSLGLSTRRPPRSRVSTLLPEETGLETVSHMALQSAVGVDS